MIVSITDQVLIVCGDVHAEVLLHQPEPRVVDVAEEERTRADREDQQCDVRGRQVRGERGDQTGRGDRGHGRRTRRQPYRDGDQPAEQQGGDRPVLGELQDHLADTGVDQGLLEPTARAHDQQDARDRGERLLDGAGEAALGESGRTAQGEHADDHGGEQRDQRRADDVGDPLDVVLRVVHHDVDECLDQHQHDGQQHVARVAPKLGRRSRSSDGTLRDHLLRRLDVHPAGGVPGEDRTRDDHGRDGDQHAERQRDAEVGAQRVDRDQRAGVRRDQPVHHGETRERGDADPHQRVVAALGDQQHHRDHQHDSDLEEERKPDDRGDQHHRPRHRAPARLRGSCRRSGRRHRSRRAVCRGSHRGRSGRRRPRRSSRGPR